MDWMRHTAALDTRGEAEALILALLHVERDSGADDLQSQMRSILTRAVEREVIPRLLQAHGATAAARRSVPLVLGSAHVERLVDLSMAPTEVGAYGFVDTLHRQGVAADSIYLDLLAPAANLLGDFWADDTCSFADVTIGLVRLQGIMRELGPAFLGAGRMGVWKRGVPPRAYLLPLPGEQHTFGLTMLLDFFRRAGWDVWTGAMLELADVTALVRAEWVDVVGFSLGCGERLERAQSAIKSVRAASRNPGLAVMVGGPCFVNEPGLAAALGADGTARDGRRAVEAAAVLVERAAERR